MLWINVVLVAVATTRTMNSPSPPSAAQTESGS